MGCLIIDFDQDRAESRALVCKRTILLADHEGPIRNFIADALQQGYQALTAPMDSKRLSCALRLLLPAKYFDRARDHAPDLRRAADPTANLPK